MLEFEKKLVFGCVVCWTLNIKVQNLILYSKLTHNMSEPYKLAKLIFQNNINYEHWCQHSYRP